MDSLSNRALLELKTSMDFTMGLALVANLIFSQGSLSLLKTGWGASTKRFTMGFQRAVLNTQHATIGFSFRLTAKFTFPMLCCASIGWKVRLCHAQQARSDKNKITNVIIMINNDNNASTHTLTDSVCTYQPNSRQRLDSNQQPKTTAERKQARNGNSKNTRTTNRSCKFS